MNPIILNYSQCIKQEAHWGYNKFHNICDGTWHAVNWGSFDWTSTIVGALGFLALVMVPVLVIGSMVAQERANQKMMEKFAF